MARSPTDEATLKQLQKLAQYYGVAALSNNTWAVDFIRGADTSAATVTKARMVLCKYTSHIEVTITDSVIPASKYTTAQMQQAFDQVSDKKHWKNEIKATIDNPGEKNLACLEAAILEFTGSVPSFTHKAGKVTVQADGYYATEAECLGF